MLARLYLKICNKKNIAFCSVFSFPSCLIILTLYLIILYVKNLKDSYVFWFLYSNMKLNVTSVGNKFFSSCEQPRFQPHSSHSVPPLFHDIFLIYLHPTFPLFLMPSCISLLINTSPFPSSNLITSTRLSLSSAVLLLLVLFLFPSRPWRPRWRSGIRRWDSSRYR